MIKIQSPGVFSGNLLDYDSTHSINAKINELMASNAYAVCDTAGDTAAKTITIQNYELRTGVQLVVKFANTNSEENPTLNVSNTGAKPIYANGQAVGLSVIKSGYAFIIAYNGTQYEIVGGVSGSDMFIGTTAEWEALSSTQKAEYDGKIVNITDDYETGEFAISGVIAPNEISPTRESHVSGSYITFNNSIYVCKTNIAKNETLIIDTNIELASLPEKTVVCYDDDEPEPYTKPGHTVIDSSGSSVVDRAGLQFGDGFDITDDSTNNKTIVTPGDALARKSDISTIVCTGSTNTTGSTIATGVYFYLNGALCKALADIANGATFTLNTNFEVVSVCEELTQLNSNLTDKVNLKFGFPDYIQTLGTITTQNGSYTATKDCCAIGSMVKSANGQAIVYVDTNNLLATSNDATMVSIFVPLKKGQTISTRSTYGVYAITIFALRG